MNAVVRRSLTVEAPSERQSCRPKASCVWHTVARAWLANMRRNVRDPAFVEDQAEMAGIQ
jgi:hypothetical protein